MTPIPPKDIIAAKLLRLAQLTTLHDQIQAEQQSKVEAIKAATSKAMAPTVAEMDTLEAEIKDLAMTHKDTLFKEVRTFRHQKHNIRITSSTVYETDNEEDTIAQLEQARDNPNAKEDHRMAAAACLHTKTALDKTYVKANWKRFRSWFEDHFGFHEVTKDSVKINLDLTPDSKA